MQRVLDKTTTRRRAFRPLALALLAAGLAAAWGCQSSTQFNLSEYEKLVERRRSETARRATAAAPAAQVAQAPAPAADAPAAAPAAKPPRSKPSKPKTPAPAGKPAAAPEAPAAPAVSSPVVEIVPPPAVEPPPAAPAPAPVEVVAPPAAAPAAPAPAPEPLPPPPARSAAANGVYVLAKGDIVQIALRGIPESQLIEDSLDEYGMISLPFINEVFAEGLTASELEQRIRNKYRDDQIYPNVTVQVQVPTRYYYMQGEIRAPGKVQLVSATRLSQAIAAAGGGTEFWNGKVQLRRNGEIFRTVKNAKRLEKTPEDDILLEPGDIVELMRSYFW